MCSSLVDMIEEDDYICCDLFYSTKVYKVVFVFSDRFRLVEVKDGKLYKQRTVTKKWVSERFISFVENPIDFYIYYSHIQFILVLLIVAITISSFAWLMIKIMTSTG